MLLSEVMGNPIVRVVVGVFACYRLTQLITIDDGPLNIFVWLRTAAGVYDRGSTGRPQRMLGKLYGCPWCIGVWVALAITYFVLNSFLVSDLFLLILAIAGGQAYLQGERRPR
jgi:hypothetical protein